RDLRLPRGGRSGSIGRQRQGFQRRLRPPDHPVARSQLRQRKSGLCNTATDLHLEYRRSVLEQCEQTMERLAKDPLYFAKPDRALFQDIRRYFPITAQAEVAWAVKEGVAAAVGFIEEQIEAGA